LAQFNILHGKHFHIHHTTFRCSEVARTALNTKDDFLNPQTKKSNYNVQLLGVLNSKLSPW